MNAALGVRFLPDRLAAFLVERLAEGRFADFLADLLAAFFLVAIACLPVDVRTSPRWSCATTETNSTQPARIYNRETAFFPRKTAFSADFSLGRRCFRAIFPSEKAISAGDFPRRYGRPRAPAVGGARTTSPGSGCGLSCGEPHGRPWSTPTGISDDRHSALGQSSGDLSHRGDGGAVRRPPGAGLRARQRRSQTTPG